MTNRTPFAGQMTKADLSRRVFLDVTADGTVLIRGAGQPREDGALPVFTTATHEEAEMLQVQFCRRQYDGSYRLNTPVEASALGDLSATLRVEYEAMLIRRAG